jgi:competence protein ComEC
MHPFWKTTPLFRILLPLIAGILLEWYLSLNSLVILLIGGAGILLFCIYAFSSGNIKYKISLCSGLSIHLVVVATGMALCKNNRPPSISNSVSTPKQKHIFFIQLNEPPKEKEKTYKCEATIIYYRTNEKLNKTKIPIYVYFSKDSLVNPPSYGHMIVTEKVPEEIFNRGNPGGFDFHHFSKVKGFRYQLFLNENEYTTDISLKTGYDKILFTIRENIISQIKKYIPDEQRAGLAEALLIGYREDLDKSLLKAYTRTGIVHIIAISGMHLGLIFALLNLLFSPLDRIRQTRLLKPILVLFLIWMFTLLTGAGASIVRAAVMFSFITFGQQINRKTSLLNSLCNSAFVLLLYDPFLLWDIGFQLSYAAVGSIAVFYQPIRSLINPANKLLQHLWELIAVTMAAQLITTPLCIYHFHQFPNLFLAANLVAVPLSTIILYGLIATASFGWMPKISIFTGKITDTLLQGMNSWVEWLNAFPFATTEGIIITAIECVFIYGIIFGLLGWWQKKQIIGLIVSMLFILFISISIIFNQFNNNRQCALRVYQVKNKTAVELVSGNKLYLWGDREELDGLLKKDSVLYLAHQFLQLNHHQIHYVGKPEGSITIKNKTIGFLNQENIPEKVDHCEVLVITQNPKVSLQTLVHEIGCRQIVTDNTNSYKNIALWKEEANKMNMPFFPTKERGAFELCW